MLESHGSGLKSLGAGSRRYLSIVRKTASGMVCTCWFLRGIFQVDEKPDGGGGRASAYTLALFPGALTRLILRLGFPTVRSGFEKTLRAI